MNYGKINKNDIANGPGVRVSLFVSGCRRNCKGCFNKEAQRFSYGAPYTKSTENEILAALAPAHIKGLTLLGGEPFEKENRQELIALLSRVKRDLPEKSVWCFSGFLFEELLTEGQDALDLLALLDVLVDGPFVEELKDLSLRFRGSSNQRILDLPKSLEKGQAVWLEGKWERTMGSGDIYQG